MSIEMAPLRIGVFYFAVDYGTNTAAEGGSLVRFFTVAKLLTRLRALALARRLRGGGLRLLIRDCVASLAMTS
jgi:hypothetical protein